MANNPGKLTKFWQELRRRKVIRVIIVYATTAFILLQLVDILLVPLHLPHWVMTFFVVLLLVGFPIAVIFSWIFDITPQGVQVTKKGDGEVKEESIGIFSKKYLVFDIIIGVLLVAVIILAYPKVFKGTSGSDLEKSIAVLPLVDDSPEEGHSHVINGLREDILNNLEKLAELRVISRTSAEKYKDSKLNLKDIGKELNANYILEGSGQKVGKRIKIFLQLIEAETDNHLWSNSYLRELNDDNTFELQTEIALHVAKELQVYITPEEKQRIEKIPTKNPVAQELFYKGLDLANKGGKENLEQAITYYKKAIEEDNEFALAYAELALTYHSLDNRNDEYINEMSYNADLAIFYDSELDKSLIAKAYVYYNIREFQKAIFFLEKAIQYNPNSVQALDILAFIYGTRIQNTEQYLEYRLKQIRLGLSLDSISNLSVIYNGLGGAFNRAGFFVEAERFYNKAVENNSDLLYFQRVFLLCDIEEYQQATTLIKEKYEKDSLDASKRVLGITYFNMKEYEEAYKLFESRHEQNLSMSNIDMLRFAFLLSKMGKDKESEKYINEAGKRIMEWDDNLVSIYRLSTAYYCLKNDTENALSQMKKILEFENYPFLIIREFRDSPLYDNIRDLQEFVTTFKEIETKFWANHDRIKANLTEKGLLPIRLQ